MNASAESFRGRPEATTRSFELVWKKNIPVVRPSNWAPGYTPGHYETPDDAVKGGLARLTQEIADVREKWVNLNAMLAQFMAADEAAEESHTEQKEQ